MRQEVIIKIPKVEYDDMLEYIERLKLSKTDDMVGFDNLNCKFEVSECQGKSNVEFPAPGRIFHLTVKNAF